MTEIAHSKLTAKRPWMFRSRTRLFLMLFMVIAVPTAILTVLTAVYVSRELTEHTIDQNTQTALLVAKHVEEEFFGLRHWVESFAMRKSLIDSVSGNNAASAREHLVDMAEQNRKVSVAFISDTNGVLRFSYPEDAKALGKDYSQRDWFKGASRSDRPYVSEVYERVVLGRAAVVTIATKIKDENGNVRGYLGAQYTIRGLLQWLESVQSYESGRFALFDHRGNQVLKLSAAPERNISDHPAIQKILKKPEGSLRIANLDGFERCLLSHAPVQDVGWTVVSYQDENVIFAPVARLLRMMTMFFLIAVTALGLLGWLWYRMLFAYAEDLHRTNKELENLCYSIAHDLRAPLRSMRGFTDAIVDEYGVQLDDTGKDYASRIVGSAGRMDKLINDLLDYGAIAHVNLTFEPIDFDESVESAIASLAKEIKSTRAEITIRKPLGKVSGDKKLVEEVCRHLLSNALKFRVTNVTPKVEIWSEPKGKCLQLWIKDNGIGIDPEYHERIFGVFQRLHGSESYSGTGIGLAIVKKAAERMGGTVGVESEAGKGSAFWVQLPIK